MALPRRQPACNFCSAPGSGFALEGLLRFLRISKRPPLLTLPRGAKPESGAQPQYRAKAFACSQPVERTGQRRGLCCADERTVLEPISAVAFTTQALL